MATTPGVQPLKRESPDGVRARISPAGLLLAASVLVAAANLRPSITAVGPVLHLVAQDTGLGAPALGLLGAIPILTFAVTSPLVHGVSRRFGIEHTVFASLLVLAGGTILRSVPGAVADLWIGTVLLGAAIAMINVLLPTLVKRDFPDRIPVVTGAYSSILSGFAALASGFALPMSGALSWRGAIGAWAILAVLSAAVWFPRLRRDRVRHGEADRARHAASPGSMWRSPLAWQVAVYMGAQSTGFYLLITWLPTIEATLGVDPIAAGWHLFLYQMMNVVAGLGVTAFLQGRRDQRRVGVAVGALSLTAVTGLILAPQLVLVWVVLIGLASGSSLVIALTLVAQRSRTSADATRLSGMVQGLGYGIAALGPVGAGLLFDATGSWTPPLLIVAAAAVLQAVAAIPAGRNRFTHAASI
jgi:CP family cyanate transporter-like MFS transporter